MTPEQAIAFIEKNGIVLESASGPVPCLARVITGGAIEGSWWSHPLGKEIFHITRTVRASKHVLVCRLIRGKVTFVHERLWPALVRAAELFEPDQLAQLAEEHTAAGKHSTKAIPFPDWVPASVAVRADELSKEQAVEILDAIVPGILKTS